VCVCIHQYYINIIYMWVNSSCADTDLGDTLDGGVYMWVIESFASYVVIDLGDVLCFEEYVYVYVCVYTHICVGG